LIRRLFVLVAATTAAFAAATATPAHAAVAATASPTAHAIVAPDCRRGYYKNVSGHCIHRPSHNPSGATAKCRDGTYSYSEHASGTCSGHGGVAVWIHHP
jgi:hypothetical protein